MQNFEALTKGQIILTQEEVFKNDLTNEVDKGSFEEEGKYLTNSFTKQKTP